MSFPDDPRDLSVGLGLGQAWTNGSYAFTQVAPGSATDDPGPVLGEVLITRGRVGDAAETGPTKVDGLAIRNEDGEYSPANPSGSHYGALIPGSPARISADIGAGAVPLATYFADDFVPSWSGPGIDERVAIPGMGVLERIARLRDARSPIRRSLEAVETFSLLGFWPFEDGLLTNTAASTNLATPSQPGTLSTGSLDTTDPPAGAAGATNIAGTISLPVSTPVANLSPGFITMLFAMRSLPDTGQLMRQGSFTVTATGTVVQLKFSWRSDPDNLFGGNRVAWGNGLGSDAAITSVNVGDGEWHLVKLWISTSGSDLSASVSIDGGSSSSATISSVALGDVSDLHDFSATYWDGSATQTGSWDLTNLAVWAADSSLVALSVSALAAYDGEPAATRITRVAGEINSLAITLVTATGETAADDVVLGPQAIENSIDILRDAEEAGAGVLDDSTAGKLRYTTNAALLNLTPIELDYETHLTDLVPLGIERDWRSEVIVTGSSGGEGSAANPADSSAPTTSVVRNVPSTSVGFHAGWLGSIAFLRESRFIVVLDLRANPAMLALMPADLDLTNRRLRIAGAPITMVGPGPLDLLVVGTKQRVGADAWLVECHCEPYRPYRVQQLANTPPDDDLLDGWLIPDSCSLATGVDATATSWSVSISPLMTTSADDFPCRILVDGEEVWVTACSGASSPQTWTVTRSVNDVTKAHNAGAQIELLDPLILTL